MNLRGKVLLLFATFAVVPLLAIGIFDYFDSVAALSRLIENENRNLAARLAAELDRGASRRADEVAVWALEPALVDAVDGDADPAEAALRSLVEETPWAEGARLRDDAGALVVDVPAPQPAALEACVTGHRLLIPLRRGVQGRRGGGELLVYARFDDIFPEEARRMRLGSEGYSVIADRETGELLSHESCAALHAAPGSRLAGAIRDGAQGDLVFADRDGEWFASFAPLVAGDWVVASVLRPAEFTLPYADARLIYLLLVVLITLGTALAFSMLLRRVMGSLTELTRATDQIAAGDLQPWLPIPQNDEVGHLTLAFGGMTARLRELLQEIAVARPLAMMAEFAPNLAHEIRNPLSSIRLNLQELDRDVRKGRLPAEVGGPVTVSLQEISRLEQVVQSVLAMARSDAPPEEPSDIELHKLVVDATRVLGPELRERGVTLDIELSPRGEGVVHGRPAELQGALMNLLYNAMEAMPGGGRLEVRTTWNSSVAPDALRIHVADQGPGIPPETRERIFQPFYTTKNGGTGLGLSQALRTVREHGGRLFLARGSEMVGGTEFVMELPARPVGRNGGRGRRAGAPGARGGHAGGDS
ncbi:MAG TPA: ATP-binding protein [Longimicrobiales bacterium]|nr:ATP-binding protein [Longimicrobiales bacterium]